MAITFDKYRGRDMLLSVLFNGQYEVVGGGRTDGATHGNEQVDVTDKDGDTFRKLLPDTGARTVTLTSSGVVTNSSGWGEVRRLAATGEIGSFLFQFENGRALYGDFQVASAEVTGEHLDAQQFSITLESANTTSQGVAESLPTLEFLFKDADTSEPTTGSATVNFTRSGSRSYVNEYGKLAYAGVDELALEHDRFGRPLGLSMQPASTNKVWPSNRMSPNTGTFASDVFLVMAPETGAKSPDGLMSSSSIIEDSTVNGRYVVIDAATITPSVYNTVSVFVREREAGVKRHFGFIVPAGSTDSGSNESSVFNVESRTGLAVSAGSSVKVRPLANGWCRVSMTWLANATPSSGIQLRITDSPASPASTYQGDGVSGFDVWGAQVEASQYATSLIPSSASATSRPVETLIIDTATVSGYDASKGTFSISCRFDDGLDVASVEAQVDDGTANEVIRFNKSAAGDAKAFAISGGVSQIAPGSQDVISGARVNSAIAGDSSGLSAAVRVEQTEFETNAGTYPNTLDTIRIGHNLTGGQHAGGYIERFSYYNSRLSDDSVRMLVD